jgi:hypothetical protein
LSQQHSEDDRGSQASRYDDKKPQNNYFFQFNSFTIIKNLF